MKREKVPPINTGSMADVAFLLLIFFLVTTTIQTEAGLPTTLPPWSEEIQQVPERNVMIIQLDAQGTLLIEGETATLKDLPRHIDHLLTTAQRPEKAVIQLENDEQADYASYLAVYNAVKANYNSRWEDNAQAQYGRSYNDLNPRLQQQIRKALPLVVAETQWTVPQ